MEKYDIHDDISQGSYLAPWLFIILMNDVLKVEENTKFS